MEKILTAEKIADLTAEVINLKRQSVVDKAMIDNLERKLSSYESKILITSEPPTQTFINFFVRSNSVIYIFNFIL